MNDSMPVGASRRDLIALIGTGLVTITTNSAWAQSRAAGVPLRKLTEREGATLEALGDTLLPGAAAAGIAHYVDAQLVSDTPLLMLRYLDFPMPLLAFYRSGLHALDELAGTRNGRAFHDLTAEQRAAMVGEVARANPAGWNGPPAPLFYFALRADAVDVCYGTEQGFASLQIPYMAHIPPRTKW